MFFGNFHQTWSEFVLADLGIFRYEKVHLDEAARAFQTRRQVEQFYAIYRCRELLRARDGAGRRVWQRCHHPWADGRQRLDRSQAGQTPVRDRPTPREGTHLPQALDVYRSCQHPEARIRTIRVLEKLERFAEAADSPRPGTHSTRQASWKPNWPPACCRA